MMPCEATPGRKPRRQVPAALAVAVGLALPACATIPAGSAISERPAKVQQVAGSQFKRVTLTQRAAERLAIKTTQISTATVATQSRMVVPYSAVIYDVDGSTSVYTMREDLSYVRELVTIEEIAADRAILSAGPAAGTAVVTEGAAMLYGIELGVGE